MAKPATPSAPKRKAPDTPISTLRSTRSRTTITNQQSSPASARMRSVLAKKPQEPEPTPRIGKKREVSAQAGEPPKIEVKAEDETNAGPYKKRKGSPAKEEDRDESQSPEKVAAAAKAAAASSGESPSVSEEQKQAEANEKIAKKIFSPKKRGKGGDAADCRFYGHPIPRSEAEAKWPNRYGKRLNRGLKISTSPSEDDDELLPAKNHYRAAKIEGDLYELQNDVYVKGEDGKKDYIGKIVEFFESTNKKLYFTAQWFFRAEDTVIGDCNDCGHDPKRVFFSKEKNTNVLDCIVSKITINQVNDGNSTPTDCDFYYDMMYSLPFTSFTNLTSESQKVGSASSSTVTSEADGNMTQEEFPSVDNAKLLDLYSGCGAMSTGLCIGAQLGGLKLETAWAVDSDSYACSSLKLNHPKAQVRNMNAEDYFTLIKEWDMLCKKYLCFDAVADSNSLAIGGGVDSGVDVSSESDDNSEEFEVERFLDICYGDPTECGIIGLKLKVRWKGYGANEDTWEPIENLSDCQERLHEFVRRGHKLNILPCPGNVDVICGGPPCQGISGFNRFRDRHNPLQDIKNKQIIVFMNIVEYLKPKFVLMENVVDILKFSDGYLGRYVISRLVKLNYQSRLGIMVAGCYGLPQFRGRAFVWGALTSEILPQFPLPTHNVLGRGSMPNEFERNVVTYDKNRSCNLLKELVLYDAISDLPPVENDEERDEMSYNRAPKTEFQKYIRLSRNAMIGDTSEKDLHAKLFDHRPLKMNDDDYQRVQKIPVRKGANFRDLPGLIVRPDNVVELDPAVERIYLPSKKPLVPDYAIWFKKGKSLKPFGRLWWDEIVSTVITRAQPHNRTILHPEQARVLTIRENARLQGFPDYYQLRGPVKERYKQVGNAVAIPVARALGYALGKSYQNLSTSDPLLILPSEYLESTSVSLHV